MYKSKILVVFAFLLYVISVVFQFAGKDDIASNLKCTILPVITVLYFVTIKNRSVFFTLFFVLYSISELLVFIEASMPYVVYYYLGNILYILAYTFLIIEISKSISLHHILKNYKMHVFVLIILNVYLAYVLQVIVNPYVEKTNEYYVELVYNIVMLSLLSVALLSYFYRDNVKSLNLFLAALCIVFAEVIWVAYTYISARSLLNVVSITLYALSFYFFFKQSKLIHEDKQEEVSMLVN